MTERNHELDSENRELKLKMSHLDSEAKGLQSKLESIEGEHARQTDGLREELEAAVAGRDGASEQVQSLKT